MSARTPRELVADAREAADAWAVLWRDGRKIVLDGDVSPAGQLRATASALEKALDENDRLRAERDRYCFLATGKVEP